MPEWLQTLCGFLWLAFTVYTLKWVFSPIEGDSVEERRENARDRGCAFLVIVFVWFVIFCVS